MKSKDKITQKFKDTAQREENVTWVLHWEKPIERETKTLAMEEQQKKRCQLIEGKQNSKRKQEKNLSKLKKFCCEDWNYTLYSREIKKIYYLLYYFLHQL